jgi:hypothetical protein
MKKKLAPFAPREEPVPPLVILFGPKSLTGRVETVKRVCH